MHSRFSVILLVSTVVTIPLSGTISQIQWLIGRKSSEPCCIWGCSWGWSCPNFV